MSCSSLPPIPCSIGATYGMKGDFPRALPFFERAVTSLRKKGDSTLLAGSLDHRRSPGRSVLALAPQIPR